MAQNVLHFNGRDSKVDIPFSAQLNPKSFTVEIWAKAIGGSGTWRSPLTSRDDGPARGFILYAGENNDWQFWIGMGEGWVTISGPQIEPDKWTHLAGTYDESSKNMLFYVNGSGSASIMLPWL